MKHGLRFYVIQHEHITDKGDGDLGRWSGLCEVTDQCQHHSVLWLLTHCASAPSHCLMEVTSITAFLPN